MLGRIAMRIRRSSLSPFRALGAGLIAGAFGSLAQTLFFAATKSIAPKPPDDAFSPPEPEQASESETQTVARRVASGVAQRPIDAETKQLGGQLVHYAFGAGWGGLYGLTVGPSRRLRGPLGVLAFSTLVWGLSDNVILPLFKLAGPPTAYPAKSHAYALAAHVVYGTAVAVAFDLLRPASAKKLVALGAALGATRGLPALIRRPVRSALGVVRGAEIGDRLREVADASLGV
jgi:hypothetical protein